MRLSKQLGGGLFLIILLFLVGCGEKSQESVVSKLEENFAKTDGYKVEAEMLMKTGQEEQKYKIDVWFKKKDFYRIALTNAADEQGGQIILKNEDGVFVLTPALKKSFKFQSDWPENSSQPYLLQSLLKDVVNDANAEFEATDQHYIFRTQTNYTNNTLLPFQEIYFDKEQYTPVLVKVLDKDKQAQVEVRFAPFELNPSLAKEDFQTEETLASAASSESGLGVDPEAYPFTITFPLNTLGAELIEQKELETDEGKRVILTYEGPKNFTLIEQEETSLEATASMDEKSGEMIHLAHALGFLTKQTIEWNKDGMNYILASDELTREELIEVANSVQGLAIK